MNRSTQVLRYRVLLLLSARMPTSTRRKSKVLIVDDNPAVLKLLGTQFRNDGMAVVLASSAKEAREALEASHWNFDLVLSDISMPGETGFDLLKWIKCRESPHRDLPVLLVTAQLPEPENRVKGLAMGAVDYVVRSLDMAELVIRAAHAIEHSQRVRSLEMSLQDSENLAMVGRLLAASHHEIMNLATLVNLAADQTVKCFAGSTDARGAEALHALAQSAELLTDVARSVSSLLQPSAAVGRPVNLRTLVDEVAVLMRPRIEPCRLELRCDGDLWATAHTIRVKQVLINLILNARDAIKEFETEASGLITLSVSTQNGMRKMVVKDNGIGFDPASDRSEFKPFATTKSLRGGQGLGLWLCSTLVKNMGGKLSLHSDGVGYGAEAILTLPIAEEQSPDEFEVQRYLDEMEDF